MSRLAQAIGPGDHVRGSPGAPVTLLEYGDYECPFCGRAYYSVEEVLRRMGDGVCYVYRHFPLSQVHPHAPLAAQAAEAAGAQGRFWPMHSVLFENQHALDLDDLVRNAQTLGLDVARFADELRNEAHMPKVRAEFSSGVRSGVNATPTFFINATRLDGSWEPDALITALSEAAGGVRHAAAHANGT